MKPSKYDLRIARADHLAVEYPFATQALTFFKQLSRLQAQLYADMDRAFSRRTAASGSPILLANLPPEEVLPRLPDFLVSLEKLSPEPLAHAARALKQQSREQWGELFTSCWQCSDSQSAPVDTSEMALAKIFLQPFAEYLAEQDTLTGIPKQAAVCPFCSHKPLLGALRPEGEGGKRFLTCSMCATEWPCGRILCPACGEQNPDKLAVYSTEQFAHVRIEACDTCRSYIKTVDLTKTGRAIPIVDELATIPLNLWAAEHGYHKIQANLLGV